MDKIFSTKITNKQASDSGMAMVLILLILGFVFRNDLFFALAIPVLIVNMTVPRAFYPFAVFWFAFSALLGSIMSKILLSIVYILIVLPVAIIRRLLGKDTLLLNEFKKSGKSVFKTRNHVFSSGDLENPF